MSDRVEGDTVEVGRAPGMLVKAVGRSVMKDCGDEPPPATTTEVDVMISVVVLVSATGWGVGGGGGVSGAVAVAELGSATGCGAGEVGRPDGVVTVAESEVGVVVVEVLVVVVDVDVASPTPGIKGVMRLFRPLIPSQMMLSGSGHIPDMTNSCHRNLEYPLRRFKNPLRYYPQTHKGRHCTAAYRVSNETIVDQMEKSRNPLRLSHHGDGIGI